jgi:DNA-binding response OmpR family regulator
MARELTHARLSYDDDVAKRIAVSGATAARILIAEDDPNDARLLQRALEGAKGANFEFRYVECLADAIAWIESGWPDVLLLDLLLPDSRGMETVERARAAGPALPIVVLTGVPQIELGDALAPFGVHDYLVKGETSPQVLLRSLRYAIRSMELAISLRRHQADLLALQALMDVTAFHLSREGEVHLIGDETPNRTQVIAPAVIDELGSCFADHLEEGHRVAVRVQGGSARVLRAGPDDLLVALTRGPTSAAHRQR